MTFHVSVLYPNKDDVTFDMKYYLATHMPLVERSWKPEGLLKWDVIEYSQEADGSQGPYIVAAHLTWKDEESFNVASKGSAAPAIFEDIPKFCNHSPSFAKGKIVGGN